MAYQPWSVVFGEQPSATKWNILGQNDASFNDGTGIGEGVIINKHLKPSIGYGVASNTNFGSSDTDVVSASAIVPTTVSTVYITVMGDVGSDQANNAGNLIVKEGSTTLKTISWFTEAANTRDYFCTTHKLTAVTAASHTYKLVAVRTVGAGTCSVDAGATIKVDFYDE